MGNFDSANTESVRFVIDGTFKSSFSILKNEFWTMEDMTFVTIVGTNDLQNGKVASDLNKTLKIQLNNSYHSTHR